MFIKTFVIRIRFIKFTFSIFCISRSLNELKYLILFIPALLTSISNFNLLVFLIKLFTEL